MRYDQNRINGERSAYIWGEYRRLVSLCLFHVGRVKKRIPEGLFKFPELIESES